MATMNISLPDQMKDFVEASIVDGRFSNASDYVRSLIRKEQEKAEFIAYIQSAVDEGIASGFSEANLDTLMGEIKNSKKK
jgi:antitoxin ParD1/3/4